MILGAQIQLEALFSPGLLKQNPFHTARYQTLADINCFVPESGCAQVITSDARQMMKTNIASVEKMAKFNGLLSGNGDRPHYVYLNWLILCSAVPIVDIRKSKRHCERHSN